MQNKTLEKWEEKTLDEICNFSRGLTYSKKDEVEFSNNIVLRANNIDLVSNSLNFDELKYINSEIIIPDDKKIKTNSIMICISSGSKSHLGKVAFIDKNYGCAFGGFMGLITPNVNIFPKFLYYMLISPAFKNLIFNLTDGANINNLKYSDLKDFKLNLPSLSEQQRLVKILDEAFENIKKAKQNALQNLNNAKELFERKLASLFKNGTENWERKTLGEISSVSAGNSAPQNKALFENGTYPFFRTADVGKIHFGKIYTSNDLLNENGIKSLKLFKKGTILIPKSGASTFLNHRVKMEVDGYVVSHLATVKGNNEVIDDDFLLYFLSTIKIQDIIQDQNYPSVNLQIISNIKVMFPCIESQKEIVTQLDELQEQTKKLEQIYEQKIKDLDELKQSILQKAFNGEL